MTKSEIKQKHSELKEIISENMTISELIDETAVDVFNSTDFTGYQREINIRHVSKIVKYITDEFQKGNFIFPSPIICSNRRDDNKLYIVDGQHRVSAFKKIRTDDPTLFNQIKDYEMNVITLIDPTIKLEVDTFITINKTSKKVDTSLALIAKTLHSGTSGYTKNAKKQYILVETARQMNSSDDSYYFDNIAWEGTPKSTGKLISLNTFVRAYMPIVNYLISVNIIDLDNSSKIDEYITNCTQIINLIWKSFEYKWPKLFKEGKNTIIQGTIGSSAITKFIINYLKLSDVEHKDLLNTIASAIERTSDSYENWLPNGNYSNYSSGAGHTIISKILMDSID